MIVLGIMLIGTPALSVFLIDGSVLSSVGGLYITYPAVLYASAKYSSLGASLSSMLAGLSTAICTLIFYENSIKEKWKKIVVGYAPLIWVKCGDGFLHSIECL